LEVQVWVTYQPDSSDVLPRTRDKLIGLTSLDLTSLADSRRSRHRIRFDLWCRLGMKYSAETLELIVTVWYSKLACCYSYN